MSTPSVNVYARGSQKPVAQYSNCLLPANIVDKVNVLTQDMISQPNTRYIVKWDYDLRGRTIRIPDNCMLSFEGGSFYNGTVFINGADIFPNYDSLAGAQNMVVTGYPKAGVSRWDYNNEKPLWSTGEKWVNALGGDVETD